MLSRHTHRVAKIEPTHPLAGKVVYVPAMAEGSVEAFSAVFRWLGIEAYPTPPSDERTRELGARFTAGDECYPAKVTVGDFLRVIEQPGFNPKRTMFFMPTAEGPCRFGQYSPYLRNSLWEAGYALDTIETAIPWTNVINTALEVQEVIQGALLDRGEKVLVFAHLSHVYRDGASIYVTYLYRRAEDPLETLQRWQIIKCAASRVILTHGGTISHQHGVGLDHAAYLAEEKAPLGIKALETLCSQFDPGRNMNPGKLLLDNY